MVPEVIREMNERRVIVVDRVAPRILVDEDAVSKEEVAEDYRADEEK